MIKPAILLADDDPALLQCLQSLLESKFEVVASVSDGCALIGAAKTLVPDLITTESSLPRLNGIRAPPTETSPAFCPDHFPDCARRAGFSVGRKVGALGYVIKRFADSDLIPGIREVLQGRSVVSHSARQSLLSRKPSKELPCKLETFRVIRPLAD